MKKYNASNNSAVSSNNSNNAYSYEGLNMNDVVYLNNRNANASSSNRRSARLIAKECVNRSAECVVLTRDEEARRFAEIARGGAKGAQAKSEIAAGCNATVECIARQIAPSGALYETLSVAGREGAWQAVGDYNAKCGASFSRFYTMRVVRSMAARVERGINGVAAAQRKEALGTLRQIESELWNRGSAA